MTRSHKLMILFCIIMAGCAFLAGACSSPGTPSPSQDVRSRQGSPATGGANLADIHTGKDFASCEACHGKTTAVDDNETVVNDRCISCHGTMTKSSGTKKDHIDPHRSHIGTTSCTVCHHGHTASRSYCLNCHSFPMSIPAGTGRTKAPAHPPRNDRKADSADIVIIGAGAAGFTAAITAHDLGAKVIVVEKQPITGGNSMLAAGGMNAARTKAQAAKKITDSPDLMFKDTMTGGRNKSDPDLVTILAQRSAESVDWLTSIGADVSDVGRLAGASVNRAHRPAGGAAVGANLITALRKNAADRKIDVRVNTTALQILRDPSGTVTGVQVQGKHRGIYTINAKAVIVASGGFSANAAMVESYRPEYGGMTTSNQPGATGDGMKLGDSAGGQLIDMKEIQIHPTVAAGSRILITEAVRGNGAILVNKDGVRFVNELTTRDAASAAILKQRDKIAFLVFDEGIRKSLRQIEGYFHLDLVKEGATIGDLASAIGVPGKALETAVAAYNKAVDDKKDTAFQRPDMPRPIRTAKYYAIAVQPGIHYTMGGLRIDRHTQVLGKDGKPVPGLFAAGEVTGGVHGANRLGGNSISETVTFGRIAGAEASKRALKR